MLALKTMISSFFQHVQDHKIEIYNEFSLQHELGIYLRERLPQYKVQFERNVSYFSSQSSTIKKEIDISIFTKDYTEKYAIELKCPLKGQYPEQMYSFVKDIKFMEQLKALGFAKTACVALVSDKPFYQGTNNRGIYKFFREEYAVYGNIYKPTGSGKDEESMSLSGSYAIDWKDLNAQSKFYIVEIE
ncbi:hypothetical protein [Paenibacillus naphthalenovorans]|uniref:Uncharacterized protein n=1 Tax=Paenibacillus naphthalenovorans TaxID=162209 RepID=A0A0U2WC56_9BACL|nr:hypothetical protein [Paenibacillus naphthalenovorans]ALS25077.1 hypothetical protein IJ22_48150 [Paenibacillus naphthalenovorans]